MQPPAYSSMQEYGQLFTKVEIWQPFVEEVCRRHGLPLAGLHAGLAGTHPVFLVGGSQRYAIKFYETRLFAGARSYRAEHELYQYLPAIGISAPRTIAAGMLDDAGAWPYLVMSAIPGTSFGEMRAQVSWTDQLALAGWVGRVLRQLHSIPLDALPLLAWLRAEFERFIARQEASCHEQHQRWNSLPPHLVAQIPAYLAAHPRSAYAADACLIHADLTEDHVLGQELGGHWQPTGLIDFGDAWVGDRVYELVALHLSLFRTDTRLLAACLSAYGFDQALREHFVDRAMVAALLFEFNSLGKYVAAHPAVQQLASLEELAAQLWTFESYASP